ncbi:MAG: putative membrane-bound dehydrogenase-like protein [Kiritimatiellia bacterium]|jgi:putative membrane-bound dehydrogenase-like protein
MLKFNSPVRPFRHLLHACLAIWILCVYGLEAAPTREAFAQADRPIEGVPLEALELMDTNLQIKVWAQSPLIYSPVAMDCDAQGRLWLTEGIDYHQKLRVDTGQSIIVLEDTDADGVADHSQVFVSEKNLRPAPLGIAVFDNRIVLSATPSIIVYTDVDRNAVFDPAVDTREEFLTGFQNFSHDHTLHAVVGAPSGQWHFSYGNCGADLKTRDGRHFLSGCYYGYPEAIGKPSSDGHVYVGGVTMRINPDGTGLTPTGHNMRNPHDMFVTSHGDLLQSDNDDPAHCRSSWVMEHGNMGYSDLRDGSRSWEEVAKSWEEPAGWNKSLRFSRSHWRENYPGAHPPGSIYGAGSPTGNLFIEDDTLGLRGTYLVCCMVRKEVMACTPQAIDAQIEMGPHTPFLRLKAGEKGRYLLPTDVALGTDGSLFFADFYNDTSRRNNQVSGTIYRITPKERTLPKPPEIDFESIPGLVEALKSPAVNVRSHAAARLVSHGAAATKDVVNFLDRQKDDPYLLARGLWVVAQLGEQGQAVSAGYLEHENPQLVITAYRALRFAEPDQLLTWAGKLANAESMAVRREVAISLRDVPHADCRDILKPLFEGYDGRNRYYLEALGTAVTGKEADAYRDFVAAQYDDPARWSRIAKNLAWRLHTPDAIRDLDLCIRAQVPPVDEFRQLAMAFASFQNAEEREDRKKRLLALAEEPAFQAEYYQTSIQEIVDKDLNDLEGELMTSSYRVPASFGEKTEVSDVNVIAALKGDATRGAQLAAKCLMCHKLSGAGVAFGPDLTHWGASRSIEEIAHEIVHPDTGLAHGFDQPVRVSGRGNVAEGFLSNYSWHAGSLKLKVMGGITRKILFRRSGAKIDYLKTSWMPSAAEFGLSDQDVRDICEHLKGAGDQVSISTAADEPTPPTGFEPGWSVLGGDDFVNVNCQADTWRWDLGHVYCTGKPTGVIRYREPLVNFELLCEWKHKQKGGNSGVFVWATPGSIARLAAGQGRLPHGIEVQVLDLGYAEVYTERHKKPADWFTSHGDVFPVGPVKMRPFPPVAPNRKRSFPSKETTKGLGEWNHYFVRAVDGEVRLWVNGEEVSGGDGISPASGYLCLESEGAPVEFRNIRLRVLPSAETPVMTIPEPPALAAAVSLKDHPALGTWYYDGHSREVAADGLVTLREGTNVVWKRRCVSKSAHGFILEGNLSHTLKGDELHVENRYVAKQKAD